MPARAYDCIQRCRTVGAGLTFVAIGLCLTAGACGHALGVRPEPDPITLTVLASDSALLSAMTATAGDFGGTGRADPRARSWRSSVIQVGGDAAFGFRMPVPPGTAVIVAQIADTTGGMRRVLFHATIEIVGPLDDQRRLTVARAALRLFVTRLQRHLAVGG